MMSDATKGPLFSAMLHVFAISFALCLAAAPSIAPAPSIPSQLLNQVKQAMAMTTQSTNNITQAYEAFRQWNGVMGKAKELPVNVRGICFALQASCRARVGQDTLAVQSYEACLKLKDYIPNDTLYDATMGKAFALQRLMKYDEAQRAFRECDTERACVGAVTCLLRQCKAETAERILREYCDRHQDNIEAQGLLGVLLSTKSTAPNEVNEAMHLLERSSSMSSLYQWVYRVLLLRNGETVPFSRVFDFLGIASVNQCPFDDPLLIHLDDKVLLHSLLTSRNETDTSIFWPNGFVLPRDSSQMKEHLSNTLSNDSEEKKWILKQRAGYGSHSNEIMAKEQLLLLLEKDNSFAKSDSDLLCQHFVSPTLLLNGYKFTIRIYIVYFQGYPESKPQVYIAKRGLVKSASVPYSNYSTNDDRAHMTNSGREDEMGQCDLTVLESAFEKAGWSFGDFCNDITDSARMVMETFVTFAQEQDETGQALAFGKLGIPKIMGFDYIVDESRRPYLLEVNRFPGLEPRDGSDLAVKQSVVQGAWTLAAGRLGLDVKETRQSFSKMDGITPCSFERLL